MGEREWEGRLEEMNRGRRKFYGKGRKMTLSEIAWIGMIAAVIHAPLTAIFLIAEITGGYQLFMPLMIVLVEQSLILQSVLVIT